MAWRSALLVVLAVMVASAVGCTAAEPVITEEDIWQQAKENAGGEVILRPTWMPEGFEVAEEYDGGMRGERAFPNPNGSDVQYNRGDETVLIRFGVGDLGETEVETVELRGRLANLVTAPDSVVLLWKESDDAEVDQYIEGRGAGITAEDILRIAESMVEY